jgi:hypothetical protein
LIPLLITVAIWSNCVKLPVLQLYRNSLERSSATSLMSRTKFHHFFLEQDTVLPLLFGAGHSSTTSFLSRTQFYRLFFEPDTVLPLLFESGQSSLVDVAIATWNMKIRRVDNRLSRQYLVILNGKDKFWFECGDY